MKSVPAQTIPLFVKQFIVRDASSYAGAVGNRSLTLPYQPTIGVDPFAESVAAFRFGLCSDIALLVQILQRLILLLFKRE
jgi:hypothetical protein